MDIVRVPNRELRRRLTFGAPSNAAQGQSIRAIAREHTPDRRSIPSCHSIQVDCRGCWCKAGHPARSRPKCFRCLRADRIRCPCSTGRWNCTSRALPGNTSFSSSFSLRQPRPSLPGSAVRLRVRPRQPQRGAVTSHRMKTRPSQPPQYLRDGDQQGGSLADPTAYLGRWEAPSGRCDLACHRAGTSWSTAFNWLPHDHRQPCGGPYGEEASSALPFRGCVSLISTMP